MRSSKFWPKIESKIPFSQLLLLHPLARRKRPKIGESAKYARKRSEGVGGGEKGLKTRFESGKCGQSFSSCPRRKSFDFGVLDTFFKLLLLEQEEKVFGHFLAVLVVPFQQHIFHPGTSFGWPFDQGDPPADAHCLNRFHELL